MRQFATFTLDEQVFGIDVLLVREINRHMDITPVQLAPDYVRGLINPEAASYRPAADPEAASCRPAADTGRTAQPDQRRDLAWGAVSA
jgi:hypothetical protein